jgi:hypothetical protein
VSKRNAAVSCPTRRVQRIFPAVTTGPIASPPTCFHPGQIVALRRVKRTSSAVISGPTQRLWRAFTQAKSGPLRRVKRISSSVISGPTQRPWRAFTQAKSGPLRCVKRISSSVLSRPTQRPWRVFTQAKSWPLRRVKQTSSSVTTISDRRGPCALNAVRAHAVTYPAEGHLEDYAPLHGGSIASSALRKHTRKGKILDTKSWGKPDLYYMSETRYMGPPR